MKRKKKTVRKTHSRSSWIGKVVRSPKVKSIRAKIKKNKLAGKKLSKEYYKAFRAASKKVR